MLVEVAIATGGVRTAIAVQTTAEVSDLSVCPSCRIEKPGRIRISVRARRYLKRIFGKADIGRLRDLISKRPDLGKLRDFTTKNVLPPWRASPGVTPSAAD